MIMITKIGFAETPEGLRCAYKYSEIDQAGNITKSNVSGSYIVQDQATIDFVAQVKADALSRIQ